MTDDNNSCDHEGAGAGQGTNGRYGHADTSVAVVLGGLEELVRTSEASLAGTTCRTEPCALHTSATDIITTGAGTYAGFCTCHGEELSRTDSFAPPPAPSGR